jgi:excisionase family DNA binding protein
MSEKKFLTITEAAEFLGVHPETLRRWDKSKRLQAEKVNDRGDRRYNIKKIQEFKDRVKLETDDKVKAKKIVDKALDSLENVAENAKYEFEMGDFFRVPRDLSYYVLEDENRSNKFQALINLFSFVIKDGEFKSKMSGTDGNGKFWEFPSMKEFKKTDVNYVQSVLPSFKHPRIRSRIAHFLWVTEKDYKMAQQAVDEYLKVASWLNSEIKKDPEGNSAFEMLEALKSAYQIAKQIKYNTKTVNKAIADTILNFDNNSSSRWAVTHHLIEFALKNKDEYGNDFWNNVIQICEKMAKEQEQNGNLYFSRDFFSLGEKVEKSVFNLKDQRWRKSIAASLETEAKKNSESFVQSDFLVKAITEYKGLGDHKKVKELEKELDEAKKNMKFQTFSQTIDLSDWVKQTRERFKGFIEKETEEQILARLVGDNSIIPKYEKVKKQSEDIDKKYVFQALGSHTLIDSSGNMPRKYETEEEKKYNSIINQYYFSLITYEASTRVLFEELIEANKLKLETIEKFMIDHFWYGKEYEFIDPDTKKVILKSRKWVELLHPGIKAYLTCLKSIKSGNIEDATDNLVLAIDSLTPKIEGIIREFYQTIGESTVKIKTEKGGKQVTEEKGIDEFLRSPIAVDIFGNDLLILMKYVLIEIGGDNLRNNVSHCLLFKKHYHLIYAHWLFIIILRIGSYQFSIKKSN